MLNHQKELEAEVARRTRHLEAEFARRQAIEAQLVQAQKMEAIGTLAGGIAHDFNNILMSMLGYTELALGETDGNSTTHEFLLQVQTAGNRARDLVHQILTFSRRNDRKRQAITISPIVKETLKLLRASLPATIDIQTAISSDQPTLADPTEIQQVVMNLCTNAAHAMEENGGILKVSLTETLLEDDNMDDYQKIPPGAYLKLTVSDTGLGIDSEVIRRIFDPFFTTKEPGKGTGLGLSTVHGIVKDCRGMISVSSKPGRGTTFTVFFPITKTDSDATPVDQENILHGSGRILYVEDERSLADLGKIMLESLGYEVTVSCDAVEALKWFVDKPNDVDLVITDLAMPRMTGIKLAGELRRIRSDIPIIISTGFETESLEKHARDMGIRYILHKPVCKQILAQTVSRALQETFQQKQSSLPQ
jgi:nitrogen-specific signal transduction histidine kinase/CheY-like chemotaxis protein